MSAVTKRKNRDAWVYRWQENGRTRQCTMPKSVRTRRDAERVQRAWDRDRADLARGRKCAPWTIARAYEEVVKANVSPRYQVMRDRYVASLGSHFGDTPLAQITVGAIKNWIAKRLESPGRAGQVRNSTVRHEYYMLSQLFQAAIENGALVDNPCKRIILKKVLPDDTRCRDRVLSPAEIQRLVDHSQGHVRLYIVIAWATAGRMSEILQLEWGDLDRESGTVTFRHEPPERRTKNRKTRTVRIARQFMEFIASQTRVEGSPWVFSHPNGTRILNVKGGIRLATQRAGLEGVTSHTIRHSVNSALIAGGFSLTAVRDFVGHSDFRMTSHYAHGLNEEQVRVSEYLATACSGAEKSKDSCPNSCPSDELQAKIDKVLSSREIVSLVESIREVIKRETGLEPATLSLEGSGSGYSILRKYASSNYDSARYDTAESAA